MTFNIPVLDKANYPITLFPDNGQYEYLKSKAIEMNLAREVVSTLESEDIVKRYGKGCDIADLLLSK